ncbi:MAG: hypothetical protein GF384_00575 [Elusimicrobia bacterium]|nr:hypothetical protein [Elusimicrobiota bacterium]MBD3411581.1 hypothetical protein [Elusimicrobiota bacterium]
MSNNTMLAAGADIKNRFLIAKGSVQYAGPALGDLADTRYFIQYKKHITRLLKKISSKPRIIAHDMHPGYVSSQYMRTLHETILPDAKLFPIQHHHAHIASILYENTITKPIIGVAFDGTGYGTDGALWGGEFLLVEGSTFTRLAHCQYHPMPGGDRVVFEPWRMVMGILGNLGYSVLDTVPETEKKLVQSMIDHRINTPVTSSAGRLFDAAAALLNLCRYAAYEAQGPIDLEKRTDPAITVSYPYHRAHTNGCSVIITKEIFLHMLRDIKHKKSQVHIATAFHNTIAMIIAQTVQQLSRSLKIRTVGLSGGVFLNKFLYNRVRQYCARSNITIVTNTSTTNDLNIAQGQYYVSCNASKN